MVANALFIVATVLAYLVVDAIDRNQRKTGTGKSLGAATAPNQPINVGCSSAERLVRIILLQLVSRLKGTSPQLASLFI
jgi:hypothetical protein